MKKIYFKRKKYVNPFLLNQPTTDSRKNRRFNRLLVIISISAVLIGLVYFFIYANFFLVNKIMVTGNNNPETINEIQRVVSQEINGYNFFIFPKNNILLLNTEKLKRIILDGMVLDELEIKKKLFKKLEIRAVTKIPVLLWNENENYYYVDKDGTVMGAVKFKDIKYDLPLVNRGTTTQIVLNRTIIDKSNIEFIINFLANFSKKFNDFKINQVVVEQVDNNEIKFYTNEGWYMTVKVGANIDLTLENLDRLLSQKIKDRKNLEYVDLRLVDKLFYK